MTFHHNYHCDHNHQRLILNEMSMRKTYSDLKCLNMLNELFKVKRRDQHTLDKTCKIITTIEVWLKRKKKCKKNLCDILLVFYEIHIKNYDLFKQKLKGEVYLP